MASSRASDSPLKPPIETRPPSAVAAQGGAFTRAARQRFRAQRLYVSGRDVEELSIGKLAQKMLERRSCEGNFLDLSRLNSDRDLHIHSCKDCGSTAMLLCHWRCSCYPNHSLGLTNYVTNDIYERFPACRGVMFATPVCGYHVTSPLKLLMDRLVCEDGGNPDPTSPSSDDLSALLSRVFAATEACKLRNG